MLIPPHEIPIHPLANLLPPMSDEEFRQLVASIKDHGLRDPITRFEGKILDGRNRYRACLEAGIEPKFDDVEIEGSPKSFVLDRNVHRRHLSTQQKRVVIEALLKEHPEKSDRAIAQIAKVTGKMVAAKRKKMEATEEIPQSGKRVGSDGKSRAAKPKAPEKRSEDDAASMVDLTNLAQVIGAKLPRPQVATLCGLSAAEFERLVELLSPYLP